MTQRCKATPPFGLRLPPDVKRWVESKAHESERSQNYIIVQAVKAAAEAENEKGSATA